MSAEAAAKRTWRTVKSGTTPTGARAASASTTVTSCLRRAALAALPFVALACAGRAPSPVPRAADQRPASSQALACPGSATAAAPPRAPRQLIQARQTQPLAAMELSESGHLATIDRAGDVRVWDVARRALVGAERHPALHDATRIVWSGTAAEPRFAVITQRVDARTRVHWLDLSAKSAAAPACDPRGLAPFGRGKGLRWIGASGASAVVLDEARCARVPLALPPDRPANVDLELSDDGSTFAFRTGQRADEALVVWPFGAPERARRVPIKAHRGSGNFVLGPGGRYAVVSRGVGLGVEDTENEHRLAIVPLDGSGPPRTFFALPHYDRELDLSPDGARVAAISSRGSVASLHLVDTAKGASILQKDTFSLDGDIPSAVRFAPSHPWLAVATDGGPVYVFDSETGRLHGKLGAEIPSVPVHVAFPGRDTLAVTSRDRVTLWSLADGRVMRREPARAALATSPLPSGDLAVVRSPEHWLDTTFGHTGRRSSEWIQRRLAHDRWSAECPTGSWPVYVDVWPGLRPSGPAYDALSPTEPAPPSDATFPPPKSARHCLASTHELLDLDVARGVALVASDRYDVALRDLSTGARTPLEDFKPFTVGLKARFGAGGRFVWLAGDEPNAAGRARVRVWDARTGKIAYAWEATAGGQPAPFARVLALSDDARTLAISARLDSREVLVLHTPEGAKNVAEVPLDAPPTALAFGGSADTVYVGTSSGDLLAVRDGKLAARAHADGGAIESLVHDGPSGTLATVSADGAVRLWTAATLSQRVALVSFEDEESIAFSPKGGYVGTLEAAERVGWVFSDPVEPFRFAQFSSAYDAPSVLARRLRGEPVDVVARVDRPPLATILATSPTGATAKLKVHVEARERVRAVHAFVEGRPVGTKLVCAREADVELEVPLAASANVVTVTADDERGLGSNPASVQVKGEVPGRPALWVVAVGVDRYPRLPERFQLGFAAADARGIAAGFAEQAGPGKSYAEAHVTVLTDDQVTIPAVHAALEGLARMRPEDVAVVFLGGHGVKPSASAEMVFLTGGVALKKGAIDDASLTSSGIGWASMGERLARARGRVLMLLDACHSGHVAGDVVQNGRLAADLVREQRAGAVVFAAAKGRQLSYEPRGSRGLVLSGATRLLVSPDDSERHGYFTGAVLASLRSADTDADHDGAIELSELISDVGRRVSSATEARQTPWVARRELFGDFRLASAAPGAKPEAPPAYDDEGDLTRDPEAERRARAEAQRRLSKDKPKAKPKCAPEDPLCSDL